MAILSFELSRAIYFYWWLCKVMPQLSEVFLHFLGEEKKIPLLWIFLFYLQRQMVVSLLCCVSPPKVFCLLAVCVLFWEWHNDKWLVTIKPIKGREREQQWRSQSPERGQLLVILHSLTEECTQTKLLQWDQISPMLCPLQLWCYTRSIILPV